MLKYDLLLVLDPPSTILNMAKLTMKTTINLITNIMLSLVGNIYPVNIIKKQ